MKTWLKNLDTAWKAVLALCGAIIFGMVFGGWLGLPSTVESNKHLIEQNRECCEEALQGSMNTELKLNRVLCNQDPDMSYERCEQLYGGNGAGH